MNTKAAVAGFTEAYSISLAFRLAAAAFDFKAILIELTSFRFLNVFNQENLFKFACGIIKKLTVPKKLIAF